MNHHPNITPVLNPNDLPSPKGWKAREASGKAKMAAREASMDNIRIRQHVSYVMEAQADLSRAIDSRDNLRNSLNAKRSLLEVHKRNTLQSGQVHPDMQSLKFAIEDVLPDALTHAETEITAARDRLAAVEQRRDKAYAEHEAQLAGDAEDAEPVEVKRGPGRPRKGMA